MKVKKLLVKDIISRSKVEDKQSVYIASLQGDVTFHAVDFVTLVDLRQVHGDKFPIALVAEVLKMTYQQALDLSKNPVVFQEVYIKINQLFSPNIDDEELKN